MLVVVAYSTGRRAPVFLRFGVMPNRSGAIARPSAVRRLCCVFLANTRLQNSIVRSSALSTLEFQVGGHDKCKALLGKPAVAPELFAVTLHLVFNSQHVGFFVAHRFRVLRLDPFVGVGTNRISIVDNCALYHNVRNAQSGGEDLVEWLFRIDDFYFFTIKVFHPFGDEACRSIP